MDKYIIPAIQKLEKRHMAHIVNYGTENEKRLTGHHETQSMNKFNWGVANRGREKKKKKRKGLLLTFCFSKNKQVQVFVLEIKPLTISEVILKTEDQLPTWIRTW